MTNDYQCDRCQAPLNRHRYEIGYTTCMPCGEKSARERKHTIIPLHKSCYMAVTPEAARDLIKHLNKRANS